MNNPIETAKKLDILGKADRIEILESKEAKVAVQPRVDEKAPADSVEVKTMGDAPLFLTTLKKGISEFEQEIERMECQRKQTEKMVSQDRIDLDILNNKMGQDFEAYQQLERSIRMKREELQKLKENAATLAKSHSQEEQSFQGAQWELLIANLDIETIKKEVQSGHFSVNAQWMDSSGYQWTPLTYAFRQHGRFNAYLMIPIMNYLIDQDANANTPIPYFYSVVPVWTYGLSPLQYAVYYLMDEVVEHIAQKKAAYLPGTLHTIFSKRGYSSLAEYAEYYGNSTLTKQLESIKKYSDNAVPKNISSLSAIVEQKITPT